MRKRMQEDWELPAEVVSGEAKKCRPGEFCPRAINRDEQGGYAAVNVCPE